MFLALSLALPLSAAQENFGAGSQAAPWLKLPNNARSTAMGEAGVAVADDVNAASVNPAGLTQLKGQQVSFMHHAYVMDSAIEHLAYGLKPTESLGVAISLDYLNFGTIDKYKVNSGNNQLMADGSFTPSAMHLDLGAGYGFGSVSAGINAKWVSQTFDGSGSSTIGADLGALWRQGEDGFSLGLALQNFGGQLDGANLPMATRAGAAYRLPVGDKDNATIAADASLPTADLGASAYGAGLEYAGQGIYAVRAGYRLVGNGGASGATFGGGVKVSIIHLDYAFNAVGELGNTHQLSALLKF
jgi:hypothetical protein